MKDLIPILLLSFSVTGEQEPEISSIICHRKHQETRHVLFLLLHCWVGITIRMNKLIVQTTFSEEPKSCDCLKYVHMY